MGEDWQQRWREGRIGWHEAEGNANLKALWPAAAGRRVLVPMCGKTQDLRWLASRGAEVTGVELSPLAVDAFFAEQELGCTRGTLGGLPCYRADDVPITLCVGDYFDFAGVEFDALYDRGALVALTADERPRYAAHTDSLLTDAPVRLVITLEYDQRRVDGPPYSVAAAELLSYWPEMRRVRERNDMDNCPPKFREAGLTAVTEVAWLAP
jgi:thiopurine S-methyltransferase